MPWGFAAAAGLAGAAISADSARSAGNKQADAAAKAADSTVQAGRESNALNWAMYQQSLANQAPYQRGGNQAYAALMGGLGLDASNLSGSNQNLYSGAGANSYQVSAPTAGIDSPTAGIASYAPASLVNTSTQGQAINAPGYSTSVAGVGDIGVINNGASQAEMDAAANQYSGAFTKAFKPSDLNLDPAFEFNQAMGLRAVNSANAAAGRTGSGQGYVDAIQYAQNNAQNVYQQAFNNNQTQQTNLFNRLSSLAGTGQTAANTSSNAGLSTGQTMGSTLTNSANNAANWTTSGAAAQAAGTMGQANAWSNAITGAGNNYMGYNWLQSQNKG